MEEFAHSTNTIVWPWEQEFTKEKELYQRIATQKFNDFSDESVRQATSTLAWDQKTDTRAAFYASFDMFRFVIMEQAARHPDLFDFATNEPFNLFCWTPECTYWNLEPAAFANFSRTPVDETSSTTHSQCASRYSSRLEVDIPPMPRGTTTYLYWPGL